MKDSIALMYAHPFVEAIGIVSAMIDYSHRILLDSKLFSKKYLIKLETFAMNELLGRPAPRVLTLKPMVFEASWGNYEDLDQVLGLADTSGKEDQELCESQELKMHTVMNDVLMAQGKDFYAIVDAIGKYYCRMEFDKIFAMRQKDELKKKTFEVDLQKFYKNLFESAEKPSETKTTDADSNSRSSKAKNAKDFEHYRKTKRPARL